MMNKARKRIIKPDSNISQSISYQTLSPDSSLNQEFQGLTIPLEFKGENVVCIENIPHKILPNNKELVPLHINSMDPKFFSNPNMVLTHRFSIVCHLLLSNLRFDPKKRVFGLEIDNLLGTEKAALDDLGSS